MILLLSADCGSDKQRKGVDTRTLVCCCYLPHLAVVLYNPNCVDGWSMLTHGKESSISSRPPPPSQIEILNVRKSGELHLGHLKGTVDHFLKKMFGPDVKTRYRGSYFPFTEPSMEVDIWFKGRWASLVESMLSHLFTFPVPAPRNTNDGRSKGG